MASVLCAIAAVVLILTVIYLWYVVDEVRDLKLKLRVTIDRAEGHEETTLRVLDRTSRMWHDADAMVSNLSALNISCNTNLVKLDEMIREKKEDDLK